MCHMGHLFVGHGGLWAISGCIIFSNIVVTDYTSDCFIKEYQSIKLKQCIYSHVVLIWVIIQVAGSKPIS